jgi:hypothetical protein
MTDFTRMGSKKNSSLISEARKIMIGVVVKTPTEGSTMTEEFEPYTAHKALEHHGFKEQEDKGRGVPRFVHPNGHYAVMKHDETNVFVKHPHPISGKTHHRLRFDDSDPNEIHEVLSNHNL